MLPDCITENRIIVVLDRRQPDVDRDARIGQLAPALEVMVQEGQSVFSLGQDDLDVFAEMREIFDERASFGVHGVDSPDEMARTLEQQPQFILTDTDETELIRQGLDAGVATLPAALTPNEIRRADRAGAPAVQVFPADLFGSTYPEQLQQMMPHISVIPRGGLGAWAMGRWFEAGAVACVADNALVGDSLNGGNLSHLRDRMRSYLDSIPTD